ncbi:hypothetical protein ACFQI3_14950 [Hansschlegelia quercus]|uniref:Uncharacterized protein n=1 Tax=Hansschlegelia quercus TaxID=2528245 RepID=A0A4V2JD69_9HYPH|nr:hypothetical protein [Hansschlegelia quercus]TBN47270.1 hypothetical protein EYR15_16140 [Hansschlegelia quercus]
MPGFDKPKNTLPGAGESEADAAHEVQFEKSSGAGPEGGSSKGDAPDAAEAGGTKRKSGEEKEKAPPGATSPADLTTENDDGAS